MDEATKKILEIVTDIQDRMDGMATKTEVAANTIAIEKLTEKVDDLGKHTREDVDAVIKRVTVLERRIEVKS